MTTARRERRSIRSARRRAAHHANEERKAVTPEEKYQAAEYVLRSAAKRAGVRVAGELQKEIAEHVTAVMGRADLNNNQQALYLRKLAEEDTESRRLANALMCLRGAIKHLPGTERDRLIEHYTNHFRAEATRIELRGGGR
jgi:hypothetical protein